MAQDIALLTSALDDAVRELSGARSVSRCVRGLRDAAIQLRKGRARGRPRAASPSSIADAPLDELGQVARAFTQWFHLVNAAEEQHRVRLLRRHDRDAPGATTRWPRRSTTMVAERALGATRCARSSRACS